ncbi:hypothetical protein M407DRAFT_32739 [Tulasnella calospora MUT 4182]|uniref:UvrD-like helicase C-terminal domain-containing protein n=1 Tax=Tulasnella calospora MUT 4182 TaxID=1051891 RepID=A0A0C3K827_9AGAM|nr:hypothetical protein M407DRAFT_32739 [Tulasnella calospora MUT 4182]
MRVVVVFERISGCACTTGPREETIKVVRHQYGIVPAFAFTDHKAQGQTLDRVIVDIGKPATGSISQFNAYVALSRGRDPEKVWLLRPFEMQLFTQGVDPDLAEEDIRLERLNDETRRTYEMRHGIV